MADTIITKITGNETNALLLTDGDFRGQRLISARWHYRDDPADEWKPTRRGISFKPEHVSAVIEGLQKALDAGGAE